MSSDLTFTGERFVPQCEGEIAYEHWHRYAFARRFCAGKRVLDAACGEGYGTAWLAGAAAAIVGIDIDGATIAHAAQAYTAASSRPRFAVGSCARLPFADGAFDVVTSFETIEHLPQVDQAPMIAEFARVLAPEGVLVLSSPNRVLYSEARNYRNEFHLHELDRDELAALLSPHFPQLQWCRQRLVYLSGIWSDAGTSDHESWSVEGARAMPYSGPDAMYFVVVAARQPCALRAAALSLCADAGDSERARAAANAREVLRLDALLHERDATIARQAGHVVHLEALVAVRDALIVQRDAALASAVLRETHELVVAQRDAEQATRLASTARFEDEAAERDRMLLAERTELGATIDALAQMTQRAEALDRERERLDAAIEAQERIINFRQSLRWWLLLPWLRTRRAWDRLWA